MQVMQTMLKYPPINLGVLMQFTYCNHAISRYLGGEIVCSNCLRKLGKRYEKSN
jgi:hypothetical protein